MNVRSIAKSIIVMLAIVVGSSRLTRASPQHMFDEELAVSAGGLQYRSIKLAAPQPVQLVVQGLRHVDKGFTVYVLSPDDFAHMQRREMFHYVAALSGSKVRAMTQTATLAAGEWVFVVQNSENILNTMIVRLRVVVDP